MNNDDIGLHRPCNYAGEELLSKIESIEEKILNLENYICSPNYVPAGTNAMANKINQSVVINGEKKWIRANTMQEFTDKVIKLMAAPPVSSRHPFDAYAWN